MEKKIGKILTTNVIDLTTDFFGYRFAKSTNSWGIKACEQ